MGRSVSLHLERIRFPLEDKKRRPTPLPAHPCEAAFLRGCFVKGARVSAHCVHLQRFGQVVVGSYGRFGVGGTGPWRLALGDWQTGMGARLGSHP